MNLHAEWFNDDRQTDKQTDKPQTNDHPPSACSKHASKALQFQSDPAVVGQEVQANWSSVRKNTIEHPVRRGLATVRGHATILNCLQTTNMDFKS